MPSPHKPDVLDEVTGLGAPLLDDRPSAVDLLNFRQFVEALRNIVRNPATKTPFIIGVFGRWGTGKTTLMRMVEEDLKAREVHTVWFNAWVYGQENEIWAAFLQSLTTRLWKKFGPIEKARFSVRLFRHGLAWSASYTKSQNILCTSRWSHCRFLPALSSVNGWAVC
jgi:Cdc6-like AAA superfamily ATPase